MNRRSFLKWLGLGAVAGVAGAVTGCMMKTINPSVKRKTDEQPWRCANCGHLLRSDEDMTDKRCPRCYAKEMYKISEAELKKYMKAAQKKK